MSSYLNLLSKLVKIELSASNLEKAKVRSKTLLDDDLAYMKLFVVHDALASIKILLLVINLSSSDQHILCALRYKVNNLRKTYQA